MDLMGDERIKRVKEMIREVLEEGSELRGMEGVAV